MGTETPSAQAAPPPEKDQAVSKTPPPRRQPTRPLPTRRVAYAKQVEILRAYSAICGGNPKPVTNAELAAAVGLAADTIGYANPFFVAIGLLERSDAGICIPCPLLLTYHVAYQWEPERAFQKLAPIFKKAWFAEVLMPRLRFRPLTDEEAIAALAEASAATPDYKSQLKLILDFLSDAGVVVRENGTIKLAQSGAPLGSEEVQRAEPPEEAVPTNGAGDVMASQEPPKAVATTFTKTGGAGAGALDLNINIHVDMAELMQSKPECIAAFMSGLAQVLAAKGQMERDQAGR